MGNDFHKLDRQVRSCLRTLPDDLSAADKKTVAAIKKALAVLRLDIRDFEYAETKTIQQKWQKIALNNLSALEHNLLILGSKLGAADMAEIAAYIDILREGLK